MNLVYCKEVESKQYKPFLRQRDKIDSSNISDRIYRNNLISYVLICKDV